MVRALIATSGVIWSCAEILLKPRALRASVVVDTTTFDDGGISGSSSAGAAQGGAGRRSGGPSGNNRSRLVPPPLPTAGVTSPLSSKTLPSAPSTSASSSPAQLRSAAEEKLRSTDLVCITISQRAIALLFELCNGGAADERLDVNSTDAPAATSSDQVRATVQRGVEALRLRRRRPRGASAGTMISSEFRTTETALNRYWDSVASRAVAALLPGGMGLLLAAAAREILSGTPAGTPKRGVTSSTGRPISGSFVDANWPRARALSEVEGEYLRFLRVLREGLAASTSTLIFSRHMSTQLREAAGVNAARIRAGRPFKFLSASDVLDVAMGARRSGGGVSGDAGRSALSDAIALGLDSGSMFDHPSAHATSPSCAFAVDESAEGSSFGISSLSFEYAELANEVTVGGVSLKRFVARGATSRRSNSYAAIDDPHSVRLQPRRFTDALLAVLLRGHEIETEALNAALQEKGEVGGTADRIAQCQLSRALSTAASSLNKEEGEFFSHVTV